MMKQILQTCLLGVFISCPLFGQTTPKEVEAGPFSSYRFVLGEFLDDLKDSNARWRDTIIIGWGTDGLPRRAFVRMGVDQAYGDGNTNFVTMADLEAATKITWTTGLAWSQTTNSEYSADGGADVDVYFIPEYTIAEGTLPDFSYYEFEDSTAFPGSTKVGFISKDKTILNPVENWGNQSLAREYMDIEIDITDAVKSALDNNLIESGKSFAIGMLSPEFDDFDPAETPVGFADYGRMHIIGATMSYFTLSFDSVAVEMGPGVFSDYELVDNWVSTGAWLGNVYTEHYPWVYVEDLDAYINAGGDAWFFVPTGN